MVPGRSVDLIEYNIYIYINLNIYIYYFQLNICNTCLGLWDRIIVKYWLFSFVWSEIVAFWLLLA